MSRLPRSRSCSSCSPVSASGSATSSRSTRSSPTTIPTWRVYQQAAQTFGDDNFVFLVYDDPDLLTPAGMDRVAELAAAVGPDADPGRRSGSSRSTPCRCSGRSTTPCSRSTACPRWPATLP